MSTDHELMPTMQRYSCYVHYYMHTDKTFVDDDFIVFSSLENLREQVQQDFPELDMAQYQFKDEECKDIEINDFFELEKYRRVYLDIFLSEIH